jgi:phosphonate transport system substrate-binding protein
MSTTHTLLTLLSATTLVACSQTPYREIDLAKSPGVSQPAAAGGAAPLPVLRFSVAAMESPKDTYASYSQLFQRMGALLGMRIEFVQRRTYREVDDLLAEGALDAALVCTGGYLDLKRRAPGAVEVVAVPVVDGDSVYRSLIIVPSGSPFKTFDDLAGKRFAYTDELSFSGHAWVQHKLAKTGRDDRFFSSVAYTHSHDRSISAVSRGLFDGAAVHSLIYQHMVEHDPGLGRSTRVLESSPPFGMMPVVVSTRLPAQLRAKLRSVLFALRDDPEGLEALRVLKIDGFAQPTAGLFDGAALVTAELQ